MASRWDRRPLVRGHQWLAGAGINDAWIGRRSHRLAMLRRYARALDCDFVYVLVARTSLDAAVHGPGPRQGPRYLNVEFAASRTSTSSSWMTSSKGSRTVASIAWSDAWAADRRPRMSAGRSLPSATSHTGRFWYRGCNGIASL